MVATEASRMAAPGCIGYRGIFLHNVISAMNKPTPKSPYEAARIPIMFSRIRRHDSSLKYNACLHAEYLIRCQVSTPFSEPVPGSIHRRQLETTVVRIA